jgi:hypothetical protein
MNLIGDYPSCYEPEFVVDLAKNNGKNPRISSFPLPLSCNIFSCRNVLKPSCSHTNNFLDVYVLVTCPVHHSYNHNSCCFVTSSSSHNCLIQNHNIMNLSQCQSSNLVKFAVEAVRKRWTVICNKARSVTFSIHEMENKLMNLILHISEDYDLTFQNH